MLRVFVDTSDNNRSIDELNFNIQYVSFSNICSNSESIDSFKKVINQYLKNNDRIIILTLDSRISKAYYVFEPLFNNESIKVINSSLPFGGLNSVVNEIRRNKNKSLNYIEEKVGKLSELLNSFYYIWAYML